MLGRSVLSIEVHFVLWSSTLLADCYLRGSLATGIDMCGVQQGVQQAFYPRGKRTPCHSTPKVVLVTKTKDPMDPRNGLLDEHEL